MKISFFTTLLDKLKIRIPESYPKEEVVRFLTETDSERLVELPFIFRSLPEKRIKILDVGCRYSILPIQLASLGYEVWGIDIYPYQRKHPNFKFKLGDARKANFRKSFFDMIISVSTIEHIGLGFYKEEIDSQGDLNTVTKIHRLLKKGGTFVMTIPFGKYSDTDWYRVYDLERIRKLLNGFEILEMTVFKKVNNDWLPATTKELEHVDSIKEVRGVSCIKAIKK